MVKDLVSRSPYNVFAFGGGKSKYCVHVQIYFDVALNNTNYTINNMKNISSVFKFGNFFKSLD